MLISQRKSPPQKLFFILDNYWGACQGGAELQAYFLEQTALALGWETGYFFLGQKEDNRLNTRTRLFPVTRKPLWTKLKDIKYPYALKLWRILSHEKPDAIYQRCGSAMTGIAAFYAQQAGCRFVFHIASDRDVRPFKCSLKTLPLIPEMKLLEYGIKKAGTIVAQTRFQADLIQYRFNRSPVVIPNAHPVPPDCQKQVDPLIILWIGNWKSVKQPEIFIHLAQKILNQFSIEMIMVGRIGNYESLAEQARQLQIRITGEIPNHRVNTLLEKAHLLINTSEHEGFSNTFIQAWMRRVPVISLQVDPDNIIQDHQLGRCSKNFNTLVSDTIELLQNHSLRETMGAKARNFATANFALDNMNKLMSLISHTH